MVLEGNPAGDYGMLDGTQPKKVTANVKTGLAVFALVALLMFGLGHYSQGHLDVSRVVHGTMLPQAEAPLWQPMLPPI
eukprot:CAMPEP_0172817444 /NCGR_PEP_ID=MMETSP1075-20121228/13218_1 /TAXON_ID=2916 /ORGANISM="Ceratium fusus, Strain PA161109" /LENGTH=77 /DNA_ID=CAMNT_0013657651 /DNA_START=9 /DNA_END=239 /DNA_ORIENTATION=-